MNTHHIFTSREPQINLLSSAAQYMLSNAPKSVPVRRVEKTMDSETIPRKDVPSPCAMIIKIFPLAIF